MKSKHKSSEKTIRFFFVLIKKFKFRRARVFKMSEELIVKNEKQNTMIETEKLF